MPDDNPFLPSRPACRSPASEVEAERERAVKFEARGDTLLKTEHKEAVCRSPEGCGLEVCLAHLPLVILGARSHPPAMKIYPSHREICWHLVGAVGRQARHSGVCRTVL